MSYDILIFESDVVADEDFPQWWDRGSRWEEPHHYDSIERATPAIRAFYRDLIRAFPPFNGPDALSDDEVDARLAHGLPVADYTIGEDLVGGVWWWMHHSWRGVLCLVLGLVRMCVVMRWRVWWLVSRPRRWVGFWGTGVGR